MSGKVSSAERGSLSRQGRGERLATRRRKHRRRALFALGILCLFLFGAIMYGLQQPSVRISRIEVFGADASLTMIAREAMQGNYFGIIPRDSTFFLPASRIRTDLITAHPDIAAVSIFRNGLTSLSIKVDNRVPIARWCASPPGATKFNLVADCYLFDASGFIYATTTVDSTDSTNSSQAGSPQVTQPVNPFIVYESLILSDGNQTPSNAPLGSTLSDADKLPAAFDFARQLGTLGSPVVSIVLHDGEVDDYLESGTRVTYVLGNERNVFTALVSARANLNLADGSLEYVDLRFNGKMYLKKK